MAKKTKHEPTVRDTMTEEHIEQLHRELVVLPFNRENLRLAVVKVSEAFIGVGEVGKSNSGYWVDKFLAQCGLNPGFAWCLAFVQAMIKWSCDLWKQPDILPYNTAGTRALWNHYKNLGHAHSVMELIRPGDVLVWAIAGSGLGHAAVVVRSQWDGKKLVVTTVEGNVSSASWRNGGSIEYRTYTYTQANYMKPVKDRYLLGAVSFDSLYNVYIVNQA